MSLPAAGAQSPYAAIEARLEHYFDDQEARAAAHGPDYAELWALLRGAASGGKRLRPRLVVEPYLLLGGDRWEPALDFAVAIELLHTALILHDDLIDGDLRRRGEPNLAARLGAQGAARGLDQGRARAWGGSGALLAGDLLIAAALSLAASLEVDPAVRLRLIGLVDESVFLAAAGEHADVAAGLGLQRPGPDEIRAIMAHKTACYSFETPLRAAAILAGRSDALVGALGRIGRSLGVLFQMQDDLLGVFGDPESTGKSSLGDLREGKQTLLVAYARGNPSWEEAAAELFGRRDLDEAGADRLRAALEAAGARRRLEQEVLAERDRLLGLVAAAELPEALQELLAAEARHGAERRA